VIASVAGRGLLDAAKDLLFAANQNICGFLKPPCAVAKGYKRQGSGKPSKWRITASPVTRLTDKYSSLSALGRKIVSLFIRALYFAQWKNFPGQ
jgi:hypothetical protein